MDRVGGTLQLRQPLPLPPLGMESWRLQGSQISRAQVGQTVSTWKIPLSGCKGQMEGSRLQ
jgi:hypothetical protein